MPDDYYERTLRDSFLIASDFRMLPDTPGDKTAWAEYRQALRDLPNNPNWPDVPFPDPPA